MKGGPLKDLEVLVMGSDVRREERPGAGKKKYCDETHSVDYVTFDRGRCECHDKCNCVVESRNTSGIVMKRNNTVVQNCPNIFPRRRVEMVLV